MKMSMYQYKESGLRNVYLRNGFKLHSTPYGSGVSIEDVSGLHKALSLSLVLKPSRLTGPEIRFLRKEMEMSQQSLASCLGANVQTFASWEKSKAKLPGPADKMLRVFVKGHFSGNVAVRKLIDTLNNLDVSQHEGKLIFQEEDNKWVMAA